MKSVKPEEREKELRKSLRLKVEESLKREINKQGIVNNRLPRMELLKTRLLLR